MSGWVGLDKDEAERLLLLMEGDVSDFEVDGSDSEEEDNINNEEQPPVPDMISVSNLGFEIELDEEKADDENVPLAVLAEVEKQKNKNQKRKLQWTKTDIKEFDTQCMLEGVDVDEPDIGMTPLSYFKLFVEDDIINNIVYQSNLYSVQKSGTSIDTSYAEICKYLGINILSGIIRMPSYRMYWANETRIPVIADSMSRNRFEKLRTMIHFNDNSTMHSRDHPDYDKLFKVRPFVDAIQKNFVKTANEEYNSIDEIMIPFKGRSSIKQYIKNKPHKWGIKVFARAGVSGFVYDFQIYVGKGTVQSVSPLGISGDIVVKLCDSLPHNQNYKVFMDNWFTSYALLCELKQKGILACGTVRIPRMQCSVLKSEKQLKSEGRGSFDFATEQNENILIAKWFDNKTVHVTSNYKGITPIANVKRWSTAEKKYIEVGRPEIIREYNSYMGGVDLNDMLVALYRIKHSVKRYYLRIIYHLIDISIVNAWILYRRNCVTVGITKYKKLLTFRAEIAHALINKDVSILSRKRGRPSNKENESPITPKRRPTAPTPVEDVRFDSYGHFPEHIKPKKRCRSCKTAYSRLGCLKCKVALCLTNSKNCFLDFHVNK